MESEIKDGILVISLSGNLLGTQANAAIMGTILPNVEAGNKRVIFDLKGVNYMDSSGLGTLLSATSKLKKAGGQLVICSLSPQVSKLLQTTKVESIFQIEPNQELAFERLRALV